MDASSGIRRESEAVEYVRRNLERVLGHLPEMEARQFAAMVDCVIVERSLGWREVDQQGRRAERAEAERDWLHQWAYEAALALRAATRIGEREGVNLNYANHDRLLREHAALSADAEPTPWETPEDASRISVENMAKRWEPSDDAEPPMCGIADPRGIANPCREPRGHLHPHRSTDSAGRFCAWKGA